MYMMLDPFTIIVTCFITLPLGFAAGKNGNVKRFVKSFIDFHMDATVEPKRLITQEEYDRKLKEQSKKSA